MAQSLLPAKTRNLGKRTAALLTHVMFGGPMAALLHETTGSWFPVFEVVIAMDLITGCWAWL